MKKNCVDDVFYFEVQHAVASNAMAPPELRVTLRERALEMTHGVKMPVFDVSVYRDDVLDEHHYVLASSPSKEGVTDSNTYDAHAWFTDFVDTLQNGQIQKNDDEKSWKKILEELTEAIEVVLTQRTAYEQRDRSRYI